MPAYAIQPPSSDSEASEMQKLRIDMRTLVQTCMQRPESFKFKGEPTQYPLFRAEYTKVTSRYPHDDTQRLDALVRMLAEPAKSVIADCRAISDPTTALFASWKTLDATYGYMITNAASQLAAISNKAAVELSEAGLRELVADMCICEVKATTHDPQALDNESFLCALAKRLPSTLQGELATKLADTEPHKITFDLLLRFVRSRLCVASSGAATFVKGMKASVPSTQPRKDGKRAVVHNASVAEATTSPNAGGVAAINRRNVDRAGTAQNPNDAPRQRNYRRNVATTTPTTDAPSCDYCHRSGHYLNECDAFSGLTMENKRSFIVSERRCFNCMRAGHISRDCRSRFRCRTCRGKHHSFLHEENRQTVASRATTHHAVSGLEYVLADTAPNQGGWGPPGGRTAVSPSHLTTTT